MVFWDFNGQPPESEMLLGVLLPTYILTIGFRVRKIRIRTADNLKYDDVYILCNSNL